MIDDINSLFFLASQEKLRLNGVTLLFKELKETLDWNGCAGICLVCSLTKKEAEVKRVKLLANMKAMWRQHHTRLFFEGGKGSFPPCFFLPLASCVTRQDLQSDFMCLIGIIVKHTSHKINIHIRVQTEHHLYHRYIVCPSDLCRVVWEQVCI